MEHVLAQETCKRAEKIGVTDLAGKGVCVGKEKAWQLMEKGNTGEKGKKKANRSWSWHCWAKRKCSLGLVGFKNGLEWV